MQLVCMQLVCSGHVIGVLLVILGASLCIELHKTTPATYSLSQGQLEFKKNESRSGKGKWELAKLLLFIEFLTSEVHKIV